jgi:hypothetical protein
MEQGPNHHQQTVVGAVQYAVDRLTRGVGRLRGTVGDGIFTEDVGRRHQFLDFLDTQVVGIRFALRRHGQPHSNCGKPIILTRRGLYQK